MSGAKLHSLSENEESQLSSSIIGLLDSWGANSIQQINLLDLPSKTPKRAMRRYREGLPLPRLESISVRIEHLVGIAEALRTTFPRNAHMRAQWIKKPHRRFGQRSPLEVMLRDGLNGLISVRSLVDCSFSWDTIKS